MIRSLSNRWGNCVAKSYCEDFWLLITLQPLIKKLFIFGMGVPGRVRFHSTSMNLWVMPWGGARGQNLGHPNKVYWICLYKQLLSKKDGVQTSLSHQHYFHAPVILLYTLKTISWINVILGILVLCDTTIDLLINVGHLELYFMVQWFCLISWMLFDVYFIVKWFYVTSWRQFDVWLS